jgi:serine phosphatase RsbU (regulator of sigma subunit)
MDPARTSVPLHGEWLFYPNVFLKASDLEQLQLKPFAIPTGSSWTQHPELSQVQFGTYFLRVLLPGSSMQMLAIHENIGINSAFELELAPHGTIMARSGRISMTREFEIAWWLHKVFPIPELGRQQLDLLLRVSSFNYSKKGILVPPTLGEWGQLSRSSFLQKLGFLAAASTLMALAVYHFILFMVRRDDWTNLVFSLSSFLMLVRMITSDRLIEDIYPEGQALYAALNFRILYSLMVVISLLVHWYFRCLIESFHLRWRSLTRIFFIVSGCLAFVPFCVPDYPALHRLVFLFELQVSLAALMAMGLLLRHALYHPVHKFEARVCFGLGFTFLASIANDIGYMHYFWDTMTVTHFALIGLYMGQSVLVARKYRKDHALRKKLQEARAVQEAFLPVDQEVPGIMSTCFYQVADEQAGGDLYDLHHDERNQRYYAFIGDVTGHGIASALVAGAASGAIHSTLAVCQRQNMSLAATLDELAHSLNLSVLSAGRRADRLMTFSILGLDLKSGAGLYVNAGHNATFLIHGGQVRSMLHASSPLGLHDNHDYRSAPFQIEPGARLFLYTDGLIENQGQQGRTPRLKKITQIIAAASTLHEARENILQYAASLWLQHPPEDDVTFVILEWVPQHLSIKDVA